MTGRSLLYHSKKYNLLGRYKKQIGPCVLKTNGENANFFFSTTPVEIYKSVDYILF